MARGPKSLVQAIALSALLGNGLHAAEEGPDRIVVRSMPGFRLANSRDFAPAITGQDGDGREQRRTFFAADFDGDGATPDWAVIVINDAVGEHRYCLLRRNGQIDILLQRKGLVIEKPMFFKPAGVSGMEQLRYSDLVDGYSDTVDAIKAGLTKALERRRGQYRSVPAVEICTSGYDLCGTRRTWYFEAGKLRSFTAGD
jgi:hypothetical protein